MSVEGHLLTLKHIVANDALAASYQTLGQYRSMLIQRLNLALQALDATPIARYTMPASGVCKSHGMAVLITHVDDGEPCSDHLLATAPPSGKPSVVQGETV